MTQKTLTKEDLSQFTGTEQWYRHGIARRCSTPTAQSMSPNAAEPIGSSMKSLSLKPSAKSALKHSRSGS